MVSHPDKRDFGRRRSERVLAELPILVEGTVPAKGPFEEPTRAIVLSAHGALITLSMPVRCGQELVLKNRATQEEQGCRVVYLGEKQAGRTEVGIVFAKPAPWFWGLQAPPTDWKRFG